MNWVKAGDRGTKYFYLIRQKEKRIMIDEIMVNDNMIKEPDDNCKASFYFYANLFNSDFIKDNTETWKQYLKLIPKSVVLCRCHKNFWSVKLKLL